MLNKTPADKDNDKDNDKHKDTLKYLAKCAYEDIGEYTGKDNAEKKLFIKIDIHSFSLNIFNILIYFYYRP